MSAYSQVRTLRPMRELLNYDSRHQPSKAVSVSPILLISNFRFRGLNVFAHITQSLREVIADDVPRHLALDTNVLARRPVLRMIECPDVNYRIGIVYEPRVYWRPAFRTEATLCPRR